MPVLKAKTDRPFLITLICILGFISVFLSVYWLNKAPTDQFGAWYIPYLSASALLRLVFLSGIWRMRKWGANGYTIFAVLNVAFLFFISVDFVFELIISAFVIFVLLSNYSKMK